MNLSANLYKKLLHRQPPSWLQRSGFFKLCWKVLRKLLCVSIIPFVPFNWLRIVGYRLVGFRIGRNVFIGMQCYMDDVHPSRTIIEDDVTVSYRVTFACHGPRTCNHRLILRKGCYVGCNATLLGGLAQGDIEVGPYATVGAGSLVNRSIPPLATVAGLPARVVRTTRVPWGSDVNQTEALCRKYLKMPSSVPKIEPEVGEFRDSVMVTMACADAQTRIRYTEDGKNPTEESPCYTTNFRIDRTVTLRARAFKPGHFPSEVATAEFKTANSSH